MFLLLKLSLLPALANSKSRCLVSKEASLMVALKILVSILFGILMKSLLHFKMIIHLRITAHISISKRDIAV